MAVLNINGSFLGFYLLRAGNPLYFRPDNGMEWNGMEWNGMENGNF